MCVFVLCVCCVVCVSVVCVLCVCVSVVCVSSVCCEFVIVCVCVCVCVFVQSVIVGNQSFVTSWFQVNGTWDQNHNDQVNICTVYPTKNRCQTNNFLKLFNIYW